jgi:hypothetical protein
VARTFLITFKQNDAAEAFVRAITRLQKFGADEQELAESGDLGPLIDQLGTLMAAHADVNAMIARPTTYCRCPIKSSGWKKSEVFGWYVCPSCNKPNRHVVARWIALHCGSEKDLLPALLKKLFPEPSPTGRTTERDPNLETTVAALEGLREAGAMTPEEPVPHRVTEPIWNDVEQEYEVDCLDCYWRASGDKGGIQTAIDMHQDDVKSSSPSTT